MEPCWAVVEIPGDREFVGGIFPSFGPILDAQEAAGGSPVPLIMGDLESPPLLDWLVDTVWFVDPGIDIGAASGSMRGAGNPCTDAVRLLTMEES